MSNKTIKYLVKSLGVWKEINQQQVGKVVLLICPLLLLLLSMAQPILTTISIPI